MRMPPDHLRRDRVDHIGERKTILLGRHLRVIDDLQKQVAELVLQPVEIVARDRIRDLVRFLNRVGRDGGGGRNPAITPRRSSME